MRIGLLILIFFTGIANGQVMFKKTFGSAGFEHAERVLQLHDNGYIVVGSSSLTGVSSDVYMLRVDSLGNYLWSRYYGGFNVDYAKDIKVTPDSGFIICGFTNSTGFGGYDAYLLKTDKDGFIEWEKTYGGSDWDFANGLQIMPDSGYVIIGETFSFGAGNNDIYLIRTDKLGNVIWEKTYGTSENEVGKDLLITSNNQLIIAGNTNGLGAGAYDIYYARLDFNGDTIWTKTFGGPLDDIVSRIRPILWYYDLVGWSYNGLYGEADVLVLGIEDPGTVSYTQYIGTAEDERAYDFDIRPGVDMFIASDVLRVFDGMHDGQLLYTNYQGILLDSKAFGEFNTEDHSVSVCRTNDDAALLAMNTESYSLGLQDILLVKLGPHPNFDDTPDITSQFQDFTNIETVKTPVNLGIFPNPAETIVQINWPETRADVSIYDLAGNLVKFVQINGTTINVSDLSPSIYMIEINGEKHTGRSKLFIR